MTRKEKKKLTSILITAPLLVIFHFIPFDLVPEKLPFRSLIPLFAWFALYLIIGGKILIKAFKGILNGQIFDENFLMAIASLGAFALAIQSKSGEFSEAIAVMLFYQVGELFEDIAVGKSRKNISDLMDIRPDYANIEKDGKIIRVSPEEISPGQTIIVQPGEKIPLDGIIIQGTSTLNTSALTGESLPLDASEGFSVISGSINMTGVLKIKTTKAFAESTVSKILELVENSTSKKSKSENFISKFARRYTPLVCISALVLALLPPLFCRFILGSQANWQDWLYRALTFLVISCPCALVISIPLTFFAGIGGASRDGILIKGSNYLETLSKVRTVVFDKTGTLTKGIFEVTGIHHAAIDENLLIEFAALAESASSHPISRSLKKAYKKEIDRNRVREIKEISGKGITAVVDGKKVALGNTKLMEELGIEYKNCHKNGTIIHLALEGQYCGHIVISDVIKEESKMAISLLKEAGIDRTIMLTGDSRPAATDIAITLGLDDFHCELLPADKVSHMEKILKEAKEKGGAVAFAGDGINDAPVLSRADIGIAMGAMGSDAAIEAADVVLMDDNPVKIARAIRIAKKCLGIVHQNIVFSIGVKFSCLILSAFGLANMGLAIFADTGVLILAVLNAARSLSVKRR